MGSGAVVRFTKFPSLCDFYLCFLGSTGRARLEEGVNVCSFVRCFSDTYSETMTDFIQTRIQRQKVDEGAAQSGEDRCTFHLVVKWNCKYCNIHLFGDKL